MNMDVNDRATERRENEIETQTNGRSRQNANERREGRNFYDDGTMTYFWRAHTLLALLFLILFLLYEVFFNTPSEDDVVNIARGIFALIFAFILVGVTVIPDGPFKRPHPAIWRFVFILSIVYELVLIFVLYQSPAFARNFLKHLDPTLGVPLEEKDYGGNCLIYDSSVPDNPFHNVWDKMDLFVPLHFFGWWMKTLLIRDRWLCWVISILFEILEYTLEHQLPNFSECWWDHWILDAFGCNMLGIVAGEITLAYLSMKAYHWRGLWNIPTYRGKLRRIFGQFGPYTWVSFDWKPLSSIGRWFTTLMIIAIFLLAELNTFYLKYVLWIPPSNWLNLARLTVILPWGAVAMREVYMYLEDQDCHEIGRQAWVFLCVTATEFLITLKFGPETVTTPFPSHIIYLWVGIFLSLVLWTVWNFVIDPHTIKMNPEEIAPTEEHSNEDQTIDVTKSSFFTRVVEFFKETFQFSNFRRRKED